MKNKIIILLMLFYPLVLSAQIVHSVSFKDINLSEAKMDTEYIEIESGDIFYNAFEEGEPDLLCKTIRILIPDGKAIASIEISNAKVNTFDLKKKILPRQKRIPTSLDKVVEDEFIFPSKEIYMKDEVFPLNQVLNAEIRLFDFEYPVANIVVCPFQYNPVKNKLLFYSSFDLVINLKDQDTKNQTVKITKQRDARIAQEFKKILINSIDNPEAVGMKKDIEFSFQSDIVQSKASSSTPVQLSYEYVVVTSSALAPAFEKLVSWKRQKGINAGIVTMDYIRSNYTGDLISGINDDAGKLRQYLFNAYQNGLVYALLGGDRNHVPIRIGFVSNNTTDADYQIPTDLYFSEFIGDWNVDGDQNYGEPTQDSPGYQSHIFIGRLLCKNQQEIENWTEKLLCYEIYPGNGDFSYLKKAFYAQSDQMQRDNWANEFKTTYTMFTTNTIFNEKYNGVDTYNSSVIPQFPTGNDVINELNKKYGFVSIMGHGCPCRVSVATKGVSDDTNPDKHCIKAINYTDTENFVRPGGELNGLSNYGYPDINYSISCTNMPYNDYPRHVGHDDNIGKSLTTLTKAGSVAFLGNTRNGWIPESKSLGLSFGEEIKKGNYKIGIAEVKSKSSMNTANIYYRYIVYAHNLLGCPEMEMWTNTPSYFNASVTEISNNGLSVSTGGVSGCKITVISASDNGSSYFQVRSNVSNATFANVVKPYYVTITKHDYIPYIDSDVKYIQNQVYSSGSATVTGSKIIAGKNVTHLKPEGEVSVGGTANVTFQAKDEIILDKGFEVKKGATFEAKIQ